MDCPSEENLIRLKLADITCVKHMDFDIAIRSLDVFHEDNIQQIVSALESLNLGSSLTLTEETAENSFDKESDQSKILWTILLINLVFFSLK